MMRNHLTHIHETVDRQSIPVRLAVTAAALLALPALGTIARRVGAALDLGALVLPLLAVAHVPVVVALLALWSVGCELCR
jgi:hypothetical protein